MNRGRMSPPLRSSHGISHAVSTVLAELRALGSEKNRAGMARFGINPKGTLGISVASLREVAREIDGMDSKSARWIAKDALRELLPKLPGG